MKRRASIVAVQVLMIAGSLACWQWLPTIKWLSSRSHVFDRFFVSSPEAVAKRLYEITFGAGDSTQIWTYAWNTTSAALVGLVIGVVAGGACGLVLGSVRMLSEIVRPFIVAANATPRIALIPIVVLLFGPTFKGSVLVSVMVTFFIAFFSAYEGARTVAPHYVANATVLGASRFRVMLHVRLPYVVAWTLASLPLAATFSIIAVVTGEVLIGTPGLGRLIQLATSTGDATLMFAVVIVLSVLGLAIVLAADAFTRRVLHWWGK